ncbi:MAG: WD40 repeat domain-containing protein [Gemmobacter sp.]
MKDERAHLQLFDLIARDWTVPAVVEAITFNANDTAVAFACADGAVWLAATADNSAPGTRVRRAIDTGRLTIAPRDKPFLPLKVADFTAGRSSPVVPNGPANFAFAKDTGRVNTLTPGGIASHLAARAAGPIRAVACTADGATIAYATGSEVCVTPAKANAPLHLDAPATVTGLAFSPDGRTLAVAHDAGLSRWSVAAPDLGVRHTPVVGRPLDVAWRRDGAWLVACLAEDGFCTVEAATDAVHVHRNFPSAVRHAGFGLPTDTVVAAGAFRVAAWTLADQGDVVTGKPGLVLIDAIATCPNRNLVAVGYANGLLSLAEIGRPSEILLREDTGAGITAMAWSGNGAYLALAGTDGSAALVEFPDAMFKS